MWSRLLSVNDYTCCPRCGLSKDFIHVRCGFTRITSRALAMDYSSGCLGTKSNSVYAGRDPSDRAKIGLPGDS
jgi:hypothetical protein